MFERRSYHTHFTEWRAAYCRFMLYFIRGNLYLKLLFTLFVIFFGFAIGYWKYRQYQDAVAAERAMQEEITARALAK